MQALPGFHPQIIAGLRRRAWREHVNTLGYSMDSRSSTWTQRELHLIQTDAEREIPNWPADVPLPLTPHQLRGRYGVGARRRLHARRPPPRVLPSAPDLPAETALREPLFERWSEQASGRVTGSGQTTREDRTRNPRHAGASDREDRADDPPRAGAPDRENRADDPRRAGAPGSGRSRGTPDPRDRSRSRDI